MLKIDKIELPDFPLLLAPMEDVSDPPFRRLCKMHGADLMYSEFISSEGLIRDAIKSKKKLDIFDYERPVGIQIFGGDEEAMAMSAKIVETVQPDLVDINFGCPVKKVVSKGAGAGVLKDIDLMVKLTKAVVNSTELPVTVKIHARTRTQMYKGKADWEYISKVKNNPNIEIPIFGNGDIDSPETALEYREKYNIDGMMIGRGAIGYPWIFNEIKHFFQTGEKLPPPTMKDRLEAVRQHAEWSAEWKGERAGLIEMRQHYSNYFRGIPHFKEYRTKFLQVLTMQEMEAVLEEIYIQLDKE